jgi:hypothetical protein
LKKIFIFLFLTIILFNCSTILRPTKYYLFSDGALKSADKKDQQEFNVAKKAMHFRQPGHITYDYFKFPNSLTFPKDSNLFKTLVTEILRTRNKNTKTDSIVVKRYLHYKENQTNQGSKEMIEVGGKIYTNKSGHIYFRYFKAAYFPELKLNIMSLETYTHLKF